LTRPNDPGRFSADIPQDAIEAALRSVERKGGDDAPPPPAGGGESEALARDVEALRAHLELSQQKGRETLEKLREEHERHLRAAADLDNFKKRATREREETRKYGVEELLKQLLPVVDGLDRALAAAPKDDPLRRGVELVLKSLEEALARNGVKSFRAAGERFDPRVHEALAQVPGGGAAPGTVVEEHGRGFFLHERLVRPAMVTVAAGRPAGDVGGGGPATPGADGAPAGG
jgi:molecular chaperone GrpE